MPISSKCHHFILLNLGQKGLVECPNYQTQEYQLSNKVTSESFSEVAQVSGVYLKHRHFNRKRQYYILQHVCMLI